MMRAQKRTFVVPGALVVGEAGRLLEAVHVPGSMSEPCPVCWGWADIYVRDAVERWRAKEGR